MSDDPTKLNRVVALRLTDADYERFLGKVVRSGMTQSEFMRSAVLANRTSIHALPKRTALRSKLLFLASKVSNNINQIAHQANSAHLGGKLSAELFEGILSELSHLRRLFSSAVDVD